MKNSTHNGYRTDLLQLMAERMGLCQQLDTLSVGDYYSFTTYKSHPVTVIVSGGRVTHIGCTIFNSEQREGLGRDVCNFLERYCLEMLIPTKPDLSTERRLQLDGIKIQKGSLNPAKLHALCNDSTLFIHLQTSSQGYIIGWRRAEEWVELISFPMEYDLMLGTDMDERERRLPVELLSYVNNGTTDTLPNRRLLVKAWQDNYYTHKNGTYLLPMMKADHYFETDREGNLTPIYSKVYPIESLTNLFTSNFVENDFIIELRLRKYGFKTDTICIPLRNWIDYCRETGCKPFFGVVNLNEEKASCELIMQNGTMGYNHIMRVEFPINLLGERKGSIKARLDSYVNSSRIKNIFDDNNLRYNE